MGEREIKSENGKKRLQERRNRLLRNIWKVEKKLKMVKEIKEGEPEEKDENVKTQKTNTWEILKKWTRTKKEGDREELKKERKRLKEIRT